MGDQVLDLRIHAHRLVSQPHYLWNFDVAWTVMDGSTHDRLTDGVFLLEKIDRDDVEAKIAEVCTDTAREHAMTVVELTVSGLGFGRLPEVTRSRRADRIRQLTAERDNELIVYVGWSDQEIESRN